MVRAITITLNIQILSVLNIAWFSVIVFGCWLVSEPAVWAAERPNVIVIMTDDQGYGELSCHGNPLLGTPNLDQLASQSLRLVDFHVAPMCTPTRGQLMTGFDAVRNGATNVSSGRTLLRTNLSTMANYFSQNGYRTGLFGKWHLGDNYPYRPQDRGFQESLWFPSSHINSVPDFWDNDYFDNTFIHNGQREKSSGYCTDVFFSQAIEWIKHQADSNQPFFCYLPTNAPHSPLWVPESDRKAMEAIIEQTKFEVDADLRSPLIRYLAMIANIDSNMGLLLAALAEKNLVENTIVIFLSDNGSTFGHRYFNAGMRGHKKELWEGGHRVPCFIRWPKGELGQPRDIDGLTHVQDLLPTLIELCNLQTPDKPQFDGTSLADVLKNDVAVPDDRMLVIHYSRMPGDMDFPSPDSYSVVKRNEAGVLWRSWRWLFDHALYDIEADPMQQNDVALQYPEVAARMRTHLYDWWARVGPLANEPQRIIIGHEAENSTMLTACEWWDVFVDQQKQVRRADRKNGYWHLEVAEAGEYEIELRRWPRESGLNLTASLPATRVTDGVLTKGIGLPIRRGRIRMGDIERTTITSPNAESVVFQVRLGPGPVRLHTWFDDERNQPICGAYYVYVQRK